MLEKLTKESFEEHVGSKFQLPLSESESLELTLTEAAASGGTPSNREPFALIFRGPAEPVLEQAIQPLEHEKLGKLDLFLVPVGLDSDGMQYEAVFT